MPIPREVAQRREAEFEAAETAAEVAALHDKWRREDDARERAVDWRNRKLVELERRLAAVERVWNRFVKKDLDEVIADERRETAERIAAGVAKGMKATRTMHYRGVWQATERYAAGACVTRSGSLWIAMEQAEPGEKPGDGGPWKLAVKGGGKEPVVA